MTVDRLKLIREQANKLKTEGLINAPLKQEIVKQEEVPTKLPSEYKGTSFLSIARNKGTNTVPDIIAKFALQEDAADAMQVTEEQGKKINKALGRMVTGVAAAVPLLCRGDGCSYKESCLTGDTLILTNKGHERLDKIKKGDIVFSFNIQSQRLEKDTVLAFTPTGAKLVYLIESKLGNTIKATSNHKLLIKKENGAFGWSSMDTGVSVGSIIVVEDMHTSFESGYLETVGDCYEDEIVNITVLGEEDVYDITVQNNSNFVANNIVVHNCPLFKENVHVLGERCRIEMSLIEVWAQEYIEELNINPNSIIELQTLSRILEISILERRLTEYMSIHDQDLTADFITSVDQEGNSITNKGPSIAFEQREKLDRAKMKHFESLNATRERKQKIQAQQQQDTQTDTGIQDIRRDISAVVAELKRAKEATIVGEG